MDRPERFYVIDQLLHERGVVPRAVNLDTLEISLAPLQVRIDAILGLGDASAAQVHKRIRIVPIASRQLKLAHFSTVGAALIKRLRLQKTYRARSTGETTAREVSPQRLVLYRDNWCRQRC